MTSLYGCWECGRAAPSGVCMGPHEGFSLRDAVARDKVSTTSGTGAQAWADQQLEDVLSRMARRGVEVPKAATNRVAMWRRAKSAKALANLRHEVARSERERRAG